MQTFLYDEYDVVVSVSTISRLLQEKRWSKKETAKRAAERSEALRAAWRGIQPQWNADQLVFLDESAANERTGDRKRGWSPVGLICEQFRPIKRSERWSILPALTVEGYIGYSIFQGAFNAELFIEFVEEKVLPHCNPYPGPRSVLILDNASIHKNDRLRELCEDHGVLLKFLPPYSPDYNPIEATFHDLKAWIRRNYLLALDFEKFDDFLHFAIGQNSANSVGGHFKNAGYVVGNVCI
jgi:transposase